MQAVGSLAAELSTIKQVWYRRGAAVHARAARAAAVILVNLPALLHTGLPQQDAACIWA